MNTRNIYTKTLMIFLLFALLVTACAQADRRAIQAGQEAADGYAAAVQLVSALPMLADGWISGAQAGTSAWAISQAADGVPGTFVMLNKGRDIAVFIAPAAKDASGNVYWFYGAVDTTTKSIVDLCARLQICGGLTTAKTMADIDQMLQSNGFVRIDAKEIPMTVAALRLAMKYMKLGGAAVTKIGAGTISDFLVIPVFMFGVNPVFPDFKIVPLDEMPQT
jgi:hypothetical protein